MLIRYKIHSKLLSKKLLKCFVRAQVGLDEIPSIIFQLLLQRANLLKLMLEILMLGAEIKHQHTCLETIGLAGREFPKCLVKRSVSWYTIFT